MENDIYLPEKKVAYRKIDGKMVLVLPVEDKLISLNETATAIFEKMNGLTVKQIAACLCEEFDVDSATALADVIDFASRMTARGILGKSSTMSRVE